MPGQPKTLSTTALPAIEVLDDVNFAMHAAAFIDVSPQAVRQDAATESDQQAPSLFGMETEPVAGEVAANGTPSKPISIENNKCWRAAAR
jgi:hypothetical protein